MLDELKMIQGVFESQSSIQSSMVSINKTCTLPEFSTQLEASRSKFTKMAERAGSVEKAVRFTVPIIDCQLLTPFIDYRSSRLEADTSESLGSEIVTGRSRADREARKGEVHGI